MRNRRHSQTDTVSVSEASEVGDDRGVDDTPLEFPIVVDCGRSQSEAFASMSSVDLKECFTFRACLMRIVPHIMKGAFRLAIRTALEEILVGHRSGSEERMTRGWKLFMFLPRMMFFRPRRGGTISRQKLEERVRLFQEGRWRQLLDQSRANDQQAHQISARKRRQVVNSVPLRAERAKSLVKLGELSAARVALEGSEVALGTLATLWELTNPERRLAHPRQEMSPEVANSRPALPFELDEALFLISLRTSRRGAVGGSQFWTVKPIQSGWPQSLQSWHRG